MVNHSDDIRDQMTGYVNWGFKKDCNYILIKTHYLQFVCDPQWAL